jgi:tetratricopeptide (TPR) repeat protein
MIMLDKERAGVWIKIGAALLAAVFVISIGGEVFQQGLVGFGGFVKSIFQGTTGTTTDTANQAKIIQLKAKVDKNPKDVTSLTDLGNAYFDSGKYQNAISTYQQVLKLNPKAYEVMTDMGVAYNALGQNDKALEIFKGVTGADPTLANAWYNLGVIYKGKNDVPNMKFAWTRFLTLSPTGTQADQVRTELANTK